MNTSILYYSVAKLSRPSVLRRFLLLACISCLGTVLFAQSAPLGTNGFLLPPLNISSVSTNWDNTAMTRASVAFNGEVYLIVWQDSRNAATTNDIYGTRVSQSGEVLDPDGIALCTATAVQSLPRVAACGDQFLVVWNDLRNGPSSDVYGARVTGEGTVLDPNGFPIAVGPAGQSVPNVAANTSKWLVIWRDMTGDTNGDIFGSFIQTNGTISAPAGFTVSGAGAAQSMPALASNGTDFFAAWHDFRDLNPQELNVYGTRITSAGVVTTPAGLLIAGGDQNQWFPNVASAGGDFLVLWDDRRNGNADVYAARISASGTLLAGNIPISVSPGNQRDPFAVGDGTNYFIVWTDDRNTATGYDIYGTELGVNNQVFDPAGWPINRHPSTQDHPAIAAGLGHQFLIVHWAQDTTNSTYKIMGNLAYSQRPPPLTPEQLQFVADGTVSLNLTVAPGYRVIVEATSDLGTWTLLTNVVPSNPTLTVRDPVSSTADARFYRVRDALP